MDGRSSRRLPPRAWAVSVRGLLLGRLAKTMPTKTNVARRSGVEGELQSPPSPGRANPPRTPSPRMKLRRRSRADKLQERFRLAGRLRAVEPLQTGARALWLMPDGSPPRHEVARAKREAPLTLALESEALPA
jgi:hypothetical protein